MERDEHVMGVTVRQWRHDYARLPLTEKDRYQPFGVGGEDEYLAERIREVVEFHRGRTLDPAVAMQPYRE